MPISMRKKWSKAAYGRERYLAKEFLKSKSEQMNESVWALPKGATTTSVDELDAELSRAGIKSKPDFNRLLVQAVGNKSKINKIMKFHKAKKVFEGKLREQIREIIKEQLKSKIVLDKKHKSKLKKVMMKYPFKSVPLYKEKFNKIVLHVPKKEYNKAIEFLTKNKLNPRG
jgi:predicted RNase H-like nuclease